MLQSPPFKGITMNGLAEHIPEVKAPRKTTFLSKVKKYQMLPLKEREDPAKRKERERREAPPLMCCECKQQDKTVRKTARWIGPPLFKKGSQLRGSVVESAPLCPHCRIEWRDFLN